MLRRAVRAEPHRDELYRNLSALLAGEGHFDKAEEELRRAMEFSGRAHELENDLGVLMAMQGRFDDARDAFDRGLAGRAEDVPLLVNRALIEADLGHPEEAYRRLAGLSETHPRDLDVLGNLSSILMEMHRTDESLGVSRRMTEQAPYDPRGYYLAGRALYDTSRYDEARAALDRAARLDPMQVDTLISLGLCYGAMGQPQECVQTLERARGLAPNDPDVLYNLGLAYEDVAEGGAAGDAVRSDAAALYRRVLALAPAYQAAKDRLAELEA
jgi:tetratricopeptide (TPR) repeat protein